MKETTHLDKGARMEEILREYFLALGYYVVRGPRYIYEGIDITDIDLWIYKRNSLVSRERLNVDAKDRQNPHALERVLWTKGLQVSLGLEGSVVATTDSRDAVKRFGEMQGVSILDGQFLKKLKGRYSASNQRISEESLVGMIRSRKEDRIGAQWIGILVTAKSRMLSQLNFDGCNSLLNDAKFFVDEVVSGHHKSEAACRVFYFVLSLFLIAIDFIMRDLAFSDKLRQTEVLKDGFKFGNSGQIGANKIFAIAGKLLSDTTRDRYTRSEDFIRQMRREADNVNVDMLTEFFVKGGQNTHHFDLARSFETLAYSPTFIIPSATDLGIRSFISVILDYFNLDRKRFFDTFPVSIALNPSPEITNVSVLPVQGELLKSESNAAVDSVTTEDTRPIPPTEPLQD